MANVEHANELNPPSSATVAAPSLSPAMVKGLAWCEIPVGLKRVFRRGEAPVQATLDALYERKLITKPNAVGVLTATGERAVAELKHAAERRP